MFKENSRLFLEGSRTFPVFQKHLWLFTVKDVYWKLKRVSGRFKDFSGRFKADLDSMFKWKERFELLNVFREM